KADAAEIVVAAASVHALRRALEERIHDLAHMSYAIAIDRRIVHGDRPLTGNEEIAVLPPFAGG
ncbi:MAG: MoaD/ThiS family protein, partial [Flavobacteriales bacterium]|nr:MoaD/ThiS family protein [Flavobacteriales bacterium]